MHTWVHVCVCVCVCARTCMCLREWHLGDCIHAPVHALVHAPVHACTHGCTRGCMCVIVCLKNVTMGVCAHFPHAYLCGRTVRHPECV